MGWFAIVLVLLVLILLAVLWFKQKLVSRFVTHLTNVRKPPNRFAHNPQSSLGPIPFIGAGFEWLKNPKILIKREKKVCYSLTSPPSWGHLHSRSLRHQVVLCLFSSWPSGVLPTPRISSQFPGGRSRVSRIQSISIHTKPHILGSRRAHVRHSQRNHTVSQYPQLSISHFLEF